MREILSSKKNIVCLIILICVYALNTYFYNTSGDIGIILKYSKMLWQSMADGQFFDFYSYAFDRMVPGTIPNYNYFIYLFFAICLSPVYLINSLVASPISMISEILVVNTFLLGFVILSGILIYKFSQLIGLNKQRSLEVFFIEQTSIVLIFCSVGFCQFDIVYLDIVLWSLFFFYKKQYVRFSLVMSVAIMFKILPLIIFVPLILLVEKRILKILEYIVIGLSSTIIYSLVVRIDTGYQKVSDYSSQSLNFLSRIFSEDIRISWGYISVFVILFLILCFVSYDYSLSDKQIINAIIVIPVLAYGAFIITVAWHPQWIVVVAPFISLAIVLNQRVRSLPWIEALFGMSMVALLNVGLSSQVDNYMTNNGLVAVLFDINTEGETISDVISPHFQYGSMLTQSVLIASTIYLMVMVVIVFRKNINLEQINQREYDLSYKLGIYLRPAFLIVYPLSLFIFNAVF